MDHDENRGVAAGMTVVGSDNGKVGKIVEVSRDYVVVQKGFFFPTDHFIPVSAIASVGDDEVFLNVTKHDALNQGWDQQPVTADAGDADAGNADAGYTEPAHDDIASNRVATGDSETIRVPVYAEELTAVTRDVDRGAILITKELVTEQRTITVPVTEERVTVTRVPVGTPGSVGAEAFDDGPIEIPVRGQEVDVEKVAKLAGEVVVEKEAVQGVERVRGTVRHEEVRVDEQGTGVPPPSGDRKRRKGR